MRKSVKRSDPDYDPQGHKYKVFLNGEKISGCHTADEEKGEAFVYLKDVYGNYVLDEYGTCLPLTKRLTGKVEIRLKNDKETNRQNA